MILKRKAIKELMKKWEEEEKKTLEKALEKINKKRKPSEPKLTVSDRVLKILTRTIQGYSYHTLNEELSFNEEVALIKLFSEIGYSAEFYKDGDMYIIRAVPKKNRRAVRSSSSGGFEYPPYIAYNPIYREIYAAMHKLNRNFVQVNIGPTGSGKSWGGLRQCYDIDPEFDPRESVFFEASELLDRIMDEDLRKGEAHLWDEVGVAINVRRFWSLKNLITSYIIQTFRFRNTLLIETVPALDLIDSQVRRLIHGVMEFKPRTERNPTARATFYFVSYNPRTGKTYFIRPRITTPKYRFVITSIKMQAPPKDIVQVYEKKRRKYMLDFYRKLKDMADALEKAAEAGGEKQYRLAKALDDAVSNIERFVRKDGTIDFTKMRLYYKLSYADYSWLRNAVLNELAEAGLIDKIGKKYYYIPLSKVRSDVED